MLSGISIICDADIPRFSGIDLPAVTIIIYIGTHEMKTCSSGGITAVNQCVFNISSVFPEMPRVISCTAVNAERLCRFKTAEIILDGWLICLLK